MGIVCGMIGAMNVVKDMQGHLIVEPNVIVYSGRRYCLACRQATWYWKKHRDEDWYELGKRFYKEIMDADGIPYSREEV